MGRTAFRVISPGHSAWGLASPREVKSGRHHGQAVVSNALVARTSSRFAADFVSNRDSRPACRYQALLRAGRLGLAKARRIPTAGVDAAIRRPAATRPRASPRNDA